jgi:hypothetical protein
MKLLWWIEEDWNLYRDEVYWIVFGCENCNRDFHLNICYKDTENIMKFIYCPYCWEKLEIDKEVLLKILENE